MKLRLLEEKDSKLMYEWMHDESVTNKLRGNFSSKTLDDCLMFIRESKVDKNNIHLAIVNDEDEYMGTVSLKHIDETQRYAEFAITIRSKAMGHGYSWYGMDQILKYGLLQKGLDNIYWCVSKENIRAVKFYDKHGYEECINVPLELITSYKDINNLKWYFINKSHLIQMANKKYNNCDLINIKTNGKSGSGMLSFFESKKDIPFDVKRIYYISNVKDGVKRGFHAHKKLGQLLFCPYGEILMILDDGRTKEEILLDSPSKGIVIYDKIIWREMIWIKTNSVLCVAASDYYDESDYIRDYNEFKKRSNYR